LTQLFPSKPLGRSPADEEYLHLAALCRKYCYRAAIWTFG
jgi:hypothetical protein